MFNICIYGYMDASLDFLFLVFTHSLNITDYQYRTGIRPCFTKI